MNGTIESKLDEMRDELCAMVTCFNASHDHDVALAAQSTVECVANLSNMAAECGLHEDEWPPPDN